MPATPAWPPRSLPRLFIDQSLAQDVELTLDGAPANYLGAVLRLGAGDQVKLFDDRTGEWLAEVVEAGKRRVALRIVQHLRGREATPDLWLVFAPIKKGRIDWLIEKATELGASRLLPVLTQRTIVDKINFGRLRSHAIEAAEQCDRTAVPEVGELQKLTHVLRNWPDDRILFFADEQGGLPLAEAASPGPAAILIGPEGGFTDEEREAIRTHPQSRAVSLGPRILRAETAAMAAIALWMGSVGDWDRATDR